MDPEAIQQLLLSFQQMAKSNQELAAAVQAGASAQPAAAASAASTRNPTATNETMTGAVALIAMKVPMAMAQKKDSSTSMSGARR